MTFNTQSNNALFYNGKEFSNTKDILAVEVGLSISINKVPFTVTMQTPGNEKELVRGLLYTENIYQSIEISPKINLLSNDKDGFINAVDVEVPSSLLLKDFEGTRNIISASSCGMCGKTSLEEEETPALQNDDILNPDLIKNLFSQVSDLQKTFQQSGGTHAAGAFTLDGELLCMQEDIGRHNAVDKVIGFLVENNLLSKARCMTVSGRISYEIVHKAKVAGIPFLASVSAASSLAVEYAQTSGITLMAFCRNEKLTVYSNSNRVSQIHEIKNA